LPKPKWKSLDIGGRCSLRISPSGVLFEDGERMGEVLKVYDLQVRTYKEGVDSDEYELEVSKLVETDEGLYEYERVF